MIERLDGAVARIHSSDGNVVGAGFLVGDRQVLTCAHVVARALNLPKDTTDAPSDEIQLSFPLIDGDETYPARIVRWDPALDIAGLELEAHVAATHPVDLLETSSLWRHSFGAFGFPAGYDDGVWTEGVLRGRTGAQWIQLDGLQHLGYWVEPGFSGTAIWDLEHDGAVGMAVAAEQNLDIRSARMIPAATLLAAWPELATETACVTDSVLNPFYDRGRINDPARLFDRQRILRELRQMLAAGNSVSLVGEPEMGKSSVLYALYQTADEWLPEKRVHYFDLQLIIDEEDFCIEVLEGMERKPGGLRALRRALRSEPLVLLLDEVEKINRPAFTQNLQDVLRALAQYPTFTLAVASHRALIEVFPPESSTSPLYNIFTEKRLQPFKAMEARRFLRQRLRDTGVVFAPDEIERLVIGSGGHPARLQRLACRLFDQKRGG